MANDIIAVPAFGDGAANDVFGGSIVADHIERRGGELVHRMAEIAGDGQRFEEDFRHDNRRADVENDAALQLGHNTSEGLEIEVTRFAQHGAISDRMLVNDVGADGDMNGDRGLADHALMKQTEFPVWKLAGQDGRLE